MYARDSVSWRVHADPGMWLAGVRGLYLEALHPRAVRGVVQNSAFRRDPIGRLMRTARFVATITYAPVDEAHKAAERVRRIHSSLRGHDPDTGEAFRLDDPELLLWVHCAATASYLDVVRRCGRTLSCAESDQYVREQVRSAELVGLAGTDVPRSVGELAEYFTGIRARLHCTDEAREIYDFLVDPPMPPALSRTIQPIRPLADAVYGLAASQGWRRLSRVAYSALPAWAIELYGRPPYPPVLTTWTLRALCAGPRSVPAGWRARLLGL
jgi:uncharacterized protein (DUF2236 family)